MNPTNYTLDQVLSVMKQMNFRVFDGVGRDGIYRDYDLNIVGIRSSSTLSDSFDDAITVFYRLNKEWKFHSFSATTDPGRLELQNPQFLEAQRGGTLILKHNEQYRGVYTAGYHGSGNWRHLALIQTGALKGYRDRNRDEFIDFVNEQSGYWGANIHAASLWNVQNQVGRWSAGCQVIQKPEDYWTFAKLIEKSSAIWGKVFSYTLLHQDLFK